MRLLLIASILLGIGELHAQIPPLQLPTENTTFFQSRPNDFFMYVNRHFEGKDSQPWEAGSYGFVRNMKRSAGEVIGTRFHEGADIKPVRRDSNGVPLDPVKAFAPGQVAYVQPNSGGSNYGKYVVIQHNWGEGPICSLYAHLNSITCEVGQKVSAGTQLGVLGYTGVGINKTRAHLHFEVDLMLSDDFEGWHRKYYNSASGHGNYNGLNLSGMNGIDLIAQYKKGQIKSIAQYLKRQKPYYAVTVPAQQAMKLQARYPWLWLGPQGSYPSSEISFTSSGLPIQIKPSQRAVTKATLTGLRPFLGRHEDRTIKRISGSDRKGEITERGKRYLALLLGQF